MTEAVRRIASMRALIKHAIEDAREVREYGCSQTSDWAEQRLDLAIKTLRAALAVSEGAELLHEACGATGMLPDGSQCECGDGRMG